MKKKIVVSVSALKFLILYVKPIRSLTDPTYASWIIVHGCLLEH